MQHGTIRGPRPGDDAAVGRPEGSGGNEPGRRSDFPLPYERTGFSCWLRGRSGTRTTLRRWRRWTAFWRSRPGTTWRFRMRSGSSMPRWLAGSVRRLRGGHDERLRPRPSCPAWSEGGARSSRSAGMGNADSHLVMCGLHGHQTMRPKTPVPSHHVSAPNPARVFPQRTAVTQSATR